VFLPAVVSEDREPRWFAARYVLSLEPALVRALTHIGQEHLVLLFDKRIKKKITTRHWFPGYIFLRFDPFHDRWQQMLRAPGVIEILGLPSAIPDDDMNDLVARCPRQLARNTELTVIPAGSEVEILNGTLEGHRGVVSNSYKRTVHVELMMFGRPTRAELLTRDVKIIG